MTSMSDAPLRPMPASRVAFVGLGLVGGSLAKATKRAWPAVHISGIDRAAIIDVAKDGGIVDDAAAPDDAEGLLAQADLVVLCLPVLAILQALDKYAPLFLAHNTVVTDTGSTKGVVGDKADALALTRFIGGHPMAGKPHGGLAHADANLVASATWFLCPSAHSDGKALKLLRQWTHDLGARPVEVDALEHDRSVALTSHLPHVVVNALAEAVLDGGALDAAGGSLKDVLAVAGAPFETWGDTLATNTVAVKSALADLRARLLEIEDALDDKDASLARLRDLFARGRACKERLHG
jgi:prephenate dehydrogenase